MKDDTISRQAAVDAVEEIPWYHQNKNGEMVHGANSREHQAWYKADDIYHALYTLPPAQPGWIPCSERLPETATDVLVCNDDGKCGVAIMQTQDFYGHSEKEWNIKYCLYDWDVWDDKENGRIVAWMPLPAKPWEEEKAEGAATP